MFRCSDSIADKRFIFVTGKGGVGKTQTCAALALKLSQEGKRVLVVLCNTKERLSSLLGSGPVGPALVELQPRLWAVNVDPMTALSEYGEMVLHSRSLARLLFDNRYVTTFFQAVPGLLEWSILGKAWFHSTELATDGLTASGSYRFDVILFDAPATGHGTDMLRVPRVILEAVPPGILRRDAELAWKMFQDPAQTGVVVVTLPEEMPTTESFDLVHTIESELGLQVCSVLANAVRTELFSPSERAHFSRHHDWLAADAPARFEDAVEGYAVAAARRAKREAIQADCLTRLGALGKICRLPHLLDKASTREGTTLLAGLI